MMDRAATARPLAETVLPVESALRQALLVIGGSLVVALTAQVSVPLPLTPVPITGQTFGVLMVGLLLGSRKGALSLGLYLLEGLAGLPVFSGASGGLAHLLGPTGGYLVGFIPAAALTGWLAERAWDRTILGAAAAMVIGNLAIYLVGLAWLAFYLPLEQVLPTGLLPFIPGDLAKIALAAGLLPSAWRWLGRSSL